MAVIEMHHRFAASPERVFAAITDHAAMGTWLPGTNARVEQPGTPAPNGLGAIRAVTSRGLTVREEVIRWNPPFAMDYTLISGAPIDDHLGQIRVTSEGETSRLDYTIRFDMPWYVGGPLTAWLISMALQSEITHGLARLDANLAP